MIRKSGRAAFWLAIVFGVGACGDGGLQSPDFTPVLQALSLSSDAPADTDPAAPAGQRMLASGQTASLDVLGTFTTPPGTTDTNGQPAPTADLPVSNVSFSLSPSGVAEIVNGELVGTQVGGVVTVTANKEGITSNAISFRIVAPILTALDIQPPSAEISVTETATYSAVGTFSDGSTGPVAVDWTVSPTGTVVTLAPANGQSTVATPVTGSNGLTATITGSTVNSEGTTVSDTATVTISNEQIVALVGVRPSNPAVAVGATIDFTATAQFSDGTTTREGDVPDSQVTWSIADTAIADFANPTDQANGVATGQPPGGAQTTITATLVPAVITPAGNSRTASTTISVTDAQCTTPLLASQGATTSVNVSGLCLGCGVSNAGNVIDGNSSTFATINTLLGLLNGSATLNVDAAPATPVFTAGNRAGFVVAQPAGLLTAELLSALSVSTRLGGLVQEAAGATQTDTLDVSLLGLIGGQEAALISFVTTQPYDGIALTFNTGIASALPNINAFQACATAAATP